MGRKFDHTVSFLKVLVFIVSPLAVCIEDRSSTENLSLNFQDIEIRAALKIIADFSGLNLIASDGVNGNLTLNLKDIPARKALDILLKCKGLAKLEIDNVVIVGTEEEMALREKQSIDQVKRFDAKGPLKSAVIPISYGTAEDLAATLKSNASTLLSARGSLFVDKRTNVIVIQDAAPKIDEMRELIRKLDVPIKQIEIMTQIVTADRALEEALGFRLNTHSLEAGAQPFHRLSSDLGASTLGASAAKLGFTLARLPHGTLLDLELQALEYESKIKTLSRPKLLTLNQHRALVEQGVEIPYQETTASGAASVAFKKAVLKLEVTPQITPDNKITLDLLVSSDTPDNSIQTQNTNSGPTSRVIGLKTNRLQTRVLALNGETLVLGGVLTLTDTENHAKVPILAKIPIIGRLVQNDYKKEEVKELIIFITPRIVNFN